MFHYANQNATLSSRRLTSMDRPTRDRSGGGRDDDGYWEAPARAATSASSAGHHHARSGSDFSFASLRQSYPVDDDDEAMDVMYESRMDGERHRRHNRHHSEPANLHAAAAGLELQLTEASDHLFALLQREANDYATPPPTCYYPAQFEASDDDDQDKSKATIGPWRKRIAAWMYDVVDHFRYDRNVVSIALRYIDQYVGHLLLEHQKGHRRMDSGIMTSRGGSSSSSSDQPIKRRHFQLIAVTSLYLAIKVHGELMEDDPVSGAEYCVVTSLVHEVDGRAFLGEAADVKEQDDEDEASSDESEDELKVVHHNISDLKRRQRRGRWSMKHLAPFALPLTSGNPHREFRHCESLPEARAPPKAPSAPHSALPYKPRKRGMLGGPLRLHSFVELSRGLFAAKDITETEKKMLVALNYVVNPPTSRRIAGELLRMLALTYCSSVDGRTTNAEATATAAERMLGLDRKEILGNVLAGACAQIEGAAGVPALSIGCAPSAVAYGAVLNAVEDEFDRLAASGGSTDGTMEMECEGSIGASPKLEDFQRHYRRYSRSTSPTPATSVSIESDRELFLEAWKEQFLTGVYHATDAFLCPDSEDLCTVRELLLDHANDVQSSASPSSPTEASKFKGKRSPRSPRSVAVAGSPSRGSFSRSSFSRSGASKATLLSPYDAKGRTHGRTASSSSLAGSIIEEHEPSSFRSLSSSDRRAYYKQASEPIHESRFAPRSKTPDVTQAVGGWRSTTGEAFRPPNPNPLFFSA